MPRRGLPAQNDPSRVIGFITPIPEMDAEQQLQSLRVWCEEHGAALLRTFTEPHVLPLSSNTSLVDALDEMQVQMAGILLVARREVVAQHPVEWAVLDQLAERQGGQLLSVAGDTTVWADEILVAQQAFRAYLALRQGLPIRRGVRERRRAGLRPGGEPPYGYRRADNGENFVPDDNEQAVIKLVVEQRAKKRTLKQIAELLEAQGLKNRAGGKFAPSTLSRLIARAREERGTN